MTSLTHNSFFLYVYFNPLHVSSNLVLIIRRIVSIQCLVYVTVCRWPSGMQVRKEFPDLYTRRLPTQSDIYQKLCWYNWFSWWWARGCSKHVEDWNKHTRKKNCASSWSFTRIVPRCRVNKTFKKGSQQCFTTIHTSVDYGYQTDCTFDEHNEQSCCWSWTAILELRFIKKV
jgi:hypothetical protein